MGITEEEQRLVTFKNHLITRLNTALKLLDEMKLDRLCDKELRKAVNKHPALQLK